MQINIMSITVLKMTKHPQDIKSIKNGEEVTLTVSAIGPQPLNYKWIKDEEEISDARYFGADTNKLIITSFVSENQGNYLCCVTGGQQSVKSKPATLQLGTYC